MIDTVTPIPTALTVPSQVPLNAKEYYRNESELSDLGLENELAFTYYKGMPAYCAEERSTYHWDEVNGSETITLLPENFIYPDEWTAEGIDYSNKVYNFIKVVVAPPITIQATDNTITVVGTPTGYGVRANYVFEKIQGTGIGTVFRNRIPINYGSVGLNAIDMSVSTQNNGSNGATGELSFASGLNTRASGRLSWAGGLECRATGPFTFAFGTRAVATGISSICIGGDMSATGNSSTAIGTGGESIGSDSFKQGSGSISVGDQSVATGIFTEAQAVASLSQGTRTIAKGRYSFAGGIYSEAGSYSEVSLGSCGSIPGGNIAVMVPTDRIFNIGNGDIITLVPLALNRSDAFTVFKNGLATLPSVTNSLISGGSAKSIVTKEYLTSQKTVLVNGTNTTVVGTGTSADPFKVNVASPSSMAFKEVLIESWGRNLQYSVNTGLINTTNVIISVTGRILCKIPNNGYVVGDSFPFPAYIRADSGGIPRQGISTQYNNSNSTVIRVVTGDEVGIASAFTTAGTPGSQFDITNTSDWRLVMTILYYTV